MNDEASAAPPAWFWALAGFFLLWNLFGAFVFSVMVLIVSGNFDIASEQALSQMDEAQRAQTLVTKEVILSTPMWSNVAFAVAVGFGVLGSLAFLMRKKIAVPFFILSMIGVLVQNSYNYLFSDAVEKMGVGLSPVVILVSIVTVPLAWSCTQRDWFTRGVQKPE